MAGASQPDVLPPSQGDPVPELRNEFLGGTPGGAPERKFLGGTPGGAPERKSRKWRGTITLLVLCGIVAAVVGLVMTNFNDSTVYAKGVDQLLAERTRWVGRNVRVEGTLVRGTLKFRESPCEYEFDATRAGKLIHVHYPSCIKPDTLRDDMPDVGVTAEGKLLATGDFQASNVLAKCPSKYEMKDKARSGAPGIDPMPIPSANIGAPPANLAR